MSRSPGIIFVLEDNPERLAEMLVVLREFFPRHAVQVDDDCSAAIRYLTDHLLDVDLISLDHDLDSVPRAESPAMDHGCGRGVADFLATLPATCPVVVHSANDFAAAGMFFELKRAGWPTFRVYPRDHHNWVRTDWRATLCRLRDEAWI